MIMKKYVLIVALVVLAMLAMTIVAAAGGGQGIHWPDIDEDIAVATLLRSS